MLDDLALPAEGLRLWSIPYALMGVAIMVLAAMRFLRFKTTVNPLQPSAATYLVQDGIFEYTRNPMYLGMALILFAAVLLSGYVRSAIWLVFFIMYIQAFQIRPEEKAIRQKFGSDYDAYCQRVRAWL